MNGYYDSVMLSINDLHDFPLAIRAVRKFKKDFFKSGFDVTVSKETGRVIIVVVVKRFLIVSFATDTYDQSYQGYLEFSDCLRDA